MTSDQFMARESFAIGLTAAFHALPSFHLVDFLNSMDTYLRIKPDIPLEVRNTIFCFSFIFDSAESSGYLYWKTVGVFCLFPIELSSTTRIPRDLENPDRDL